MLNGKVFDLAHNRINEISFVVESKCVNDNVDFNYGVDMMILLYHSFTLSCSNEKHPFENQNGTYLNDVQLYHVWLTWKPLNFITRRIYLFRVNKNSEKLGLNLVYHFYYGLMPRSGVKTHTIYFL